MLLCNIFLCLTQGQTTQDVSTLCRNHAGCSGRDRDGGGSRSTGVTFPAVVWGPRTAQCCSTFPRVSFSWQPLPCSVLAIMAMVRARMGCLERGVPSPSCHGFPHLLRHHFCTCERRWML